MVNLCSTMQVILWLRSKSDFAGWLRTRYRRATSTCKIVVNFIFINIDRYPYCMVWWLALFVREVVQRRQSKDPEFRSLESDFDRQIPPFWRTINALRSMANRLEQQILVFLAEMHLLFACPRNRSQAEIHEGGNHATIDSSWQRSFSISKQSRLTSLCNFLPIVLVCLGALLSICMQQYQEYFELH